MEATTGASPPIIPTPPNTDKIKRKLLKYGVYPSPKIVHNIRKKELQKTLRKSTKKHLSSSSISPQLNESQKQTLFEQSNFQTLRREYRDFNKAIASNKAMAMKEGSDDSGGGDADGLMIGKPWERLDKSALQVSLLNLSEGYAGEKLKREYLRELGEVFDERRRDELRWVLDDDLEIQEGWLEGNTTPWEPPKRRGGEVEQIRFLVDRLSAKEFSVKDWKFGRMMKQSGLQFTEAQLLKIIGKLGTNGQWRNALSIVEWVYSDKEHKHYKSRFVYTKILSILGKTRRPREALQIFNLMRDDFHIYPDMAAYHAIAVTLGQAGLIKELVKIIESMRQKPANMRRKNWDPILEPDVVVYNAVLNACVPTCQWKGVSWVFDQIRKSGLKPNGASYGLAMEVMLQSGKYDAVHDLFQKMKRRGEAPKALTYKVLVKAFWMEGRVDEAVDAVRNMEQRGVVGTACVYYELACCLCNKGRWKDAMIEVENLKKLPLAKPLEVTFTGMIMSSMDGGYVEDCISIFEQMKDHCTPNIGTVNAMLKVYGRNDMFSEAKELYEETKCAKDADGNSLAPDVYTYILMLDASATALRWEYFEHVYKDMTLSGYQLDQSKYGSLLVEASRAGKVNLLEHAFDTILDAGEIPQSSFFTELVCQATSQHNYDRAVTLVNALAHAPFRVTEKQWTVLFTENGDRLSLDSLEKLSDALANCPIAEEPTISNLARSLHSFCKSDATTLLPNPSACSNGSSNTSIKDQNNMKFHDIEKVQVRKLPANAVGTTLNSGGDPSIKNNGITFDVSFVNNAGDEVEDSSEREIVSNPYWISDDDRRSLTRKNEDFADLGLSPNFSSNSKRILLKNTKSDGYQSDFEIDINASDKSPNGSNLPLADEILKSWKENLKKDGIFFPFQLGSN